MQGQQDGAVSPEAHGAHPQLLDVSQPFCHELFHAWVLLALHPSLVTAGTKGKAVPCTQL